MPVKVDFVLYFEHQARELEALCLLKCALELQGYTSEIIYTQSINRRHYRPDVIVVPYLYDESILSELTVFGDYVCRKIVNLQWEQVLSDDRESLYFHAPKGICKKCAHISWGRKNLKFLEDAGVDKKNIFETGNVNMDFCFPKFKEMYLTKKELAAKYALNNEKKWILFVSSFAYNNPCVLQMVEDTVGENKERLNFVHKTIESQEGIISWFSEFLQRHDEYIVIYRPHPSELFNSQINQFVKSNTNIKLISELSVRQWIAACDMITTWYSTSVVDAYYMRKNCLILRPIQMSNYEEVAVMRNADFITNYSEFENEICHNNNSFPISEENIKQFYGQRDDYSYKKIVEVLSAVFASNYFTLSEFKPVPFEKSKRYEIYLLLQSLCAFIPISKFVHGKYGDMLRNAENNTKSYKRHEIEYCKKIRNILVHKI